MKNFTLISTCLLVFFSSNPIKASVVCQAGFTYYQASGTLTIQFTDNSSSSGDLQTWLWEFGNGETSHIQNPLFTYHHAATYNVCLTITDSEGCSNQFCQDVIVAPTGPCQAEYSYLQLSETLQVNFTDASVSQDLFISWLWEFGDGHSSTQQNPSHTYNHHGVFEVCLTVTDDHGCQSINCHHIVIDPLEECEASFTYEEHGSPQTLLFSDESVSTFNIVSWTWDFGDGHISHVQNPQHTYVLGGTYNICLMIISIHGDCADTYCEEIHIPQPDSCHALFTFVPDSNHSAIHFQDHSSSVETITSFHWDFGDGHASMLEHPSHEYALPGNYNVCLTIITSSGCHSTYCHPVTIPGEETCHASFFYQEISHSTDVYFTDLSVSPDSIISWHWDFGDGHASSEQNTWHSFPHDGMYTVCLTITDASGCQNTFCEIIVIESGINDCQASYSFEFDSTEYVYLFTNTSSGGEHNSVFFWDFGDGHISHEINPVHGFPHTGLYTVCLFMLDTLTGCESHFCHHILYHEHIDEPNPPQFATLPSRHIDATRESTNMVVFPNPASEEVTIAFETIHSGVTTITIFDFMGNLALEYQIPCLPGQNTIEINTRILQKGRYSVMLTAGTQIQVQPFMIID